LPVLCQFVRPFLPHDHRFPGFLPIAPNGAPAGFGWRGNIFGLELMR
jgi:hypothetical protein